MMARSWLLACPFATACGLLVACSGSSGSVGVDMPDAADASAADPAPRTPVDGGARDATAGPPSGAQPASNGAFVDGDGGVAWWSTGLFTVADGLAADPAGSSIYGRFVSVAEPGSTDLRATGRRDGACVVLTDASIPELPRKRTEPAGILGLSFTGITKTTVPPRADGDYLQTATPAWFHAGEIATLALSGSDAVPATGLDGVVAPSPLPAVTTASAWSAGSSLVLSWTPPPLPVGAVTAYVSAAGPGGGFFLECEAPLTAGRLEVPASLRAPSLAATSSDVLTVNVVSRSTKWTWRTGWVLLLTIEHAASARTVSVGLR